MSFDQWAQARILRKPCCGYSKFDCFHCDLLQLGWLGKNRWKSNNNTEQFFRESVAGVVRQRPCQVSGLSLSLLRSCWSHCSPLGSNSFSSCPFLVLLRSSMSVQWFGAVSAHCDASLSVSQLSPRLTSASEEDCMSGVMSLLLQLCLAWFLSLLRCFLSVFGTTVASLQRARQHVRPHQTCWSYIYRLCVCSWMWSCRWSSSLLCVPRLYWGTSARLRLGCLVACFPAWVSLLTCTVALYWSVPLHFDDWPRFRVNRWVMMNAQPVDCVRQCPAGFHQSFSVGERSVSCCLSLCSPWWTSVSFVNARAEGLKNTELIWVLTERWLLAVDSFFFQLESNLTHRESSRSVSLSLLRFAMSERNTVFHVETTGIVNSSVRVLHQFHNKKCFGCSKTCFVQVLSSLEVVGLSTIKSVEIYKCAHF